MRHKVAFILGLTVLILSACSAGTQNSDTMKIGAIVFLTGPQANLGTEVKNAFELAQVELNAAGGINGKKVEVVIEDSHDNPKDAIMAFNKLTTGDLPLLITTGDVCSLKLAPLIEEKKIPAIATVAAGPDIVKDGGHMFRLFIQAERQGDTMGNFAAKSLKLSKAGILSINNEFGVSSANAFRKSFETGGGKVSVQETFEIGDRDVRIAAGKLIGSKPDAIYVTGFGPGYCTAVKQLKELGFKGAVLTDATLTVPWVEEQVGTASDGAYCADVAFSEKDANDKAFNDSYVKRFKSKPSFVAAFAYDALKLASKAANESDGTRDGIYTALSGIKNFDGLTGRIGFDGKRDASFPLLVMRVEGGKRTSAERIEKAAK